MAEYIVLRLTPPTAVDAAAFTSYLNNLTISVNDISYGQPTAGVPIGSATFVPPPFPPDPSTRIVQHETFGILQSVATALIEYIPPDPEYIAPDLLISFSRVGGQPFQAAELYYDVTLYNLGGPFPSPSTFQGIPDPSVSAFVTLAPSATLLTTPTGAAPPTSTT